MAFRNRPASPPGPDPELHQLDQHPEYARLAVLRRALMAAMVDRQRRLDILAIEAELARPISGSSRGPRADAARERLTRLRREAPTQAPAPPAADGMPPSVAAALRLVAGEVVEPTPDRAATLARLRAEHRVIDDALRVVETMMDEAKADASHAASLQLREQHREVLRSIFDAAITLAAAVEAERKLIAGLILAGYDPRFDVLIRPGLDGASRLGTLDQHDSQVSFFKRRLQDQGVL